MARSDVPRWSGSLIPKFPATNYPSGRYGKRRN
jgi:hypothetical protein